MYAYHFKQNVKNVDLCSTFNQVLMYFQLNKKIG